MMTFFTTAFVTFIACWILVPMILGVLRLFGIYTIIEERECVVYVLFGKVIGTLNEPGFYFLPSHLGWQAFIIHFFGNAYTVDLRLDQHYLRSQPVNSEEGAPMGIGIWYEMYISNPLAFIFKNNDPRGSLAANVSNSTVRCLSNLKLSKMLEDRHQMSLIVREEVSPKSQEWGYRLGSVYIRKVHFRDPGMIHQIEEKVVNRLRQVTAAIRQDGENQVNLITSAADRQAAIEFARASAIRPYVVGMALQEISKDPEIASALFEILENEKILEGNTNITLIPKGMRQDLLTQLQISPPSAT